MAGAYNRTEELEDFTHNLIRGDLCVAAAHGALGAGLFGRHKSCFCDRFVSIHYAAVSAEALRYSRSTRIRFQRDTQDHGRRFEETCSDKAPYLFDVMWPSGTSSVGVVSSIFQLQGSIMSGHI